MASTNETEALESWFRDHGGFFHPDVHVRVDDQSGFHLRSTAPIKQGSAIISAPHSLALSYLNALVDDAFPVFKQHRHRFKVETIGFFYLMAQYLNRDKSFWKPYLDSLPSPDQELTEPLFFENEQDITWLEETDVWRSALARKAVSESQYREGIEVLQSVGGIDTEHYTWHLFKWATAIYSSRSFSSRSLRPHSGKYWAAYKNGPSNGTRQAVLLDMSREPSEDLYFPVLFPGLDVANHSHDAKVDWTFDPGCFSISTSGDSMDVDAAEEVFNNYGPKSNGELLLGYGFCIPNNPHDTVGLSLKAPPAALQGDLRGVHRGYFTQEGEWNSDKATFYLKKPMTTPQTSSGVIQRPQVFHQLPEPLLEMLVYILRQERGLKFEFFERPQLYLTQMEGEGRRYLPHIARMIVQSLAPKLAKLESTPLPTPEPRNQRQRLAAIYRNGQIDILTSLISVLRTYTRSLTHNLPSTEQNGLFDLTKGPALLTLEAFLSLLTSDSNISFDYNGFSRGLRANTNTDDLSQLRAAGWEEDIWVLLLSSLHLHISNLPAWLQKALMPEYLQPDSSGTAHVNVSEEERQQAESIMDIVRTAAASTSASSIWSHEGWSAEFVARTGGKMMQWDSFMVMVKNGDGGEEARLCMYLHIAA